MTEQVAVVGGGAVGVTAAHDLAARGVDVTLYERGDLGAGASGRGTGSSTRATGASERATGASGRAAGIVYDAFAGDVDATVADRALERFREFVADDDFDFGFTPRPYVWFARAGDERRAQVIREDVERMRVNDRDVERIDPDAFDERFPPLAGVDVEAAAVAHDAATVDTGAYVEAMAERARAAGATVETGTPVALADEGTTVEPTDGERVAFDAVLVAAGAHSKRLLADGGVAIAMKPYRVQALVTDAVPDAGPTCFDATRGRYARTHGTGLLVGDGTQQREFDPDDYERAADPEFEMASLAWVAETFGHDAAVVRSWAGLCTATPDRDPLVGRVADDRELYLATGFQGHGFMRAPALAERVVDQIRGGEGTEAFDPRRFDGDEEFAVVEGMTIEE